MADKVADIPQSVHNLFPKSARRTKLIVHAWHPDATGTDYPEDRVKGWKVIGEMATSQRLRKLREAGYTFVTIEAGGVADGRVDSAIRNLIP